jgi:hypothetical protein
MMSNQKIIPEFPAPIGFPPALECAEFSDPDPSSYISRFGDISKLPRQVLLDELDRVWINFVAGFIREDELSFGGTMFPEEFERSFKDRKDYMARYIPIFNSFCKNRNIKTKICLTGMTEEVFSLVETRYYFFAFRIKFISLYSFFNSIKYMVNS